MRVLVIDDSAVARATFARMAERAGHQVVAESDGSDDASEVAARAEADAVVVDGRLYADGVGATVARLRACLPSLHIVVVAALGETDLVRAALGAGASTALLRPLVPSRVASALDPKRQP
jgi:CheY-like chemotaxis protein